MRRAPSSDCSFSYLTKGESYLHTQAHVPPIHSVFNQSKSGFHLHCSHGNCKLRLPGTSTLPITSFSPSLLGKKKIRDPCYVFLFPPRSRCYPNKYCILCKILVILSVSLSKNILFCQFLNPIAFIQYFFRIIHNTYIINNRYIIHI